MTEIASSPTSDPFAARQIIVPSMAVKRDLQLAIARHQGVCARIEFPFLAQWLWDCFAQFVDVPAVSPFAPQRLTWRLFKIFDDAEFVAAQPRLQHFLTRADPVMRLELAQRVAGLFEQIVTYRPEWLDAWREGRVAKLSATANRQDEVWQAALWRRVTDELGTSRQHPATAFLAALAAQKHSHAPTQLPTSIALFGLPTLPPQYLNVLHALSAHMEISLYLLNPCTEFWFDIVDKKRLTRLQAKGSDDFHETGNPLLAGWGKQTQSLFALLFESDAVVEASADFVEHPNTLLGATQNAILHLQEFPADFEPVGNDRSLEVHVCHSLTRELEVLHDRLLSLHATQPDLRADQILVAVPDLETAGPLIEAVFGSRSGLPFHITGRSESKQNPVARALLAILDAAVSRLPASEGIALLRDPLISRRFRLDEHDVETLVDMLQGAGLHWGMGSNSGNTNPRHTWQDALSRLLLGYAVGNTGNEAPFHGILPAGAGGSGGSSGQTRLLGQLWSFLEALDHLRQRMSQPLTPQDWLTVWQSVLDNLLVPSDDTIEDARQVRETLSALATEMAEGDALSSTTCFAAPVAKTALTQALDAAPRGGIPGGAITFSALSSLRGLPYRVVCLLGLNDGVFPSAQRPLEFDLLAGDYRPGDRQRRLDERNLFLDLLLSARETVHLSYTGRSQRDDSPLPPSVLIAELLDHLRPSLGDEQVKQLFIHHPLQAFSHRYYQTDSDPRLITFNKAPPTAEKTERTLRTEVAPFFVNPLIVHAPDSLDNNEWLSPSLGDLQTFFRHPARTLLRDRLGLRLQEGTEEIDDEEPLLMTPPDTWPLVARLLPRLLSSPMENPQDLDQLEALALAGIEVPVGAVGRAQIQPLLKSLQHFAATLSPRLNVPCLPLAQTTQTTVKATIDGVSGVSLSAHLQLRDIRPEGLIRYRFSPLSAGDYLAAWLDHLALCTLCKLPTLAGTAAMRTEHIGRSANGKIEQFAFRPVENPEAVLQDWLSAYWQGIQSPLIFPPKTAWALKREGETAARNVWFNRFQARGEALDVWWQLAFRGQLEHQDLFGSKLLNSLQQQSETLLGPLREHLESLESEGG
ncbi:MAG: exodeoxyribonuclease subunit gamma [Pseudomonadota bacterium]